MNLLSVMQTYKECASYSVRYIVFIPLQPNTWVAKHYYVLRIGIIHAKEKDNT